MNKILTLKNIFFILLIFFLLPFGTPALHGDEFEFEAVSIEEKERTPKKPDTFYPFQAGIVAGIPVGVSGRWWLTERKAVVCHWGIEMIRMLQISHIWKFNQFPEGFFDLADYFDAYYIGAGGMVRFGKGERAGIRVPIGLIKHFTLFKRPFSVDAEAAPIGRLSPSFGFNLDASISLEYRFTAYQNKP